jgi:hypothetical protein
MDARKAPEGLYERRKQVVRLSGPMAIAGLAGLSWGAVNAALKAEVDRLEKLTGKAAKPPAAGGGDKKLTADEWLAEKLRKSAK